MGDMEVIGFVVTMVLMALGIWGIAEQNVWIVHGGTMPTWLIPVTIMEGGILLLVAFGLGCLVGDR